MSVVSIVAALMFSVYLAMFGIPTTNARNLYNRALLTPNLEARANLLQQSLDNWYEDYVYQELQDTKAKLR